LFSLKKIHQKIIFNQKIRKNIFLKDFPAAKLFSQKNFLLNFGPIFEEKN
jgi:hypothetical protein